MSLIWLGLYLPITFTVWKSSTSNRSSIGSLWTWFALQLRLFVLERAKGTVEALVVTEESAGRTCHFTRREECSLLHCNEPIESCCYMLIHVEGFYIVNVVTNN